MEIESVWDYPRPPRLEFCSKEIEIIFGSIIAKTNSSFRVLETSHPPTFYLPKSAFNEEVLIPIQRKTLIVFRNAYTKKGPVFLKDSALSGGVGSGPTFICCGICWNSESRNDFF